MQVIVSKARGGRTQVMVVPRKGVALAPLVLSGVTKESWQAVVGKAVEDVAEAEKRAPPHVPF